MTDLILDGIICQSCGEVLNDIIGNEVDTPGYPRNCASCDGIFEEVDK